MKSIVYKNILVPVDYSPCSENAVLYAAEMAKSLGATLYLYHAYHISSVYTGRLNLKALNNMNEKLEKENQAQIKKVSEHIEQKFSGVKVNCLLDYTLFTDGLDNVVEKNKIDLIVIGTKGATGLNELVGSNASYIVESVKCPVLVIPQNTVFKPLKKVLYATDFQCDDAQSLKQLTELVAAFDPCIIVGHVPGVELNRDEDRMDGLREIAKEQINYSNIVYHTIAQREDVFSSLNAFIDEHQIEVIAMTRQNKSFIKRLFTGSLTKKMAYHSHIPLLAFHFKKDVQ